jgi:hypothetical protein
MLSTVGLIQKARGAVTDTQRAVSVSMVVSAIALVFAAVSIAITVVLGVMRGRKQV